MDLVIPKEIIDKIEELNQIVHQYPDTIPVPVLAKFLGVADEGLRAYIDNSREPFGISWQQMGKQNRAFKVPTVKFYFWFTNGAVGFKILP